MHEISKQKFLPLPKLHWRWRKHRKGRKYAGKIYWRNFAIAAVVIANLFLSFNFNAPTVNAAGCRDVEFIFARGSGEPVVSAENPDGGASFQKWKYWLEDALYESYLDVSFYDLGQDSADGHRYPAVPVTESFGGIINLIGAAISAGEGFAFGESVEEGVAELKAHIEERTQSCPDQKFVLGGFSQGAMVISKSLSQIDPEKIIYAATFGDPKLYLPEGNSHKGIFSKIPDACKGLNFSNYRVYVPDCYAYEGALGSYRPYQPEGYIDKLGTWCNGDDIMCSSGWSIADHIDYVNGNFYEQASRVIRNRIDATFAKPNIVTPPASEAPSSHDVAFLFDSSGSMQRLFEIYRSQAKELTQKVISAGGRVSLFAYREFQRHIWPNLRCNFGCTVEELDHEISRIMPGGGGDENEGLLSAINTVYDELDWAPGASKSIVVLTDGGFHNPDRDGSTLESIVARSLAIDPVNIYVISDGKEDDYAELVRLTNGGYFDVYSETELSTQRISERPIAKLNQESFYGIIGDSFEFDASASSSRYGEDLTFDWDLDGDGVFELANHSAKVHKTFNSEFDNFIQVKVTDSHGVNTMSAKVRIARAPEVLTQITNVHSQILSSTDSPADLRLLTTVPQEISFNTDGAKVLLALNDMPVGFITPEDGAGNFIVKDVTKSVRIVLIPYSESGYRGERTELTLQPDAQTIIEEQKPHPTNPDKTNADNPPSSTSQSGQTAISGITSHPHDTGDLTILKPVTPATPSSKSQKPSAVPLAPNTGTCD